MTVIEIKRDKEKETYREKETGRERERERIQRERVIEGRERIYRER